MKPKRVFQFVLPIILFASCVSQKPDMRTDLTVGSPTFDPAAPPIVLFDAGHGNFHNIKTTYRPFATLLTNDGLSFQVLEGLITEKSLKNIDLFIIANAMVTKQEEAGITSAFSKNEIQVLADWIQKGGSLLLIADHDPFGSAASELAKAFGVGMGSVWTVDTLRVNSVIGKTTWLEYSQANSGLGRHAILQTDSPEFAINRVITFTGQSLSFDSTWTSILQLSPAAQNYYERADAIIASKDPSAYFPVPGQSQLIAREFGAGRIVISGEAAMFTSQVTKVFFKTTHAGFNYNGYDNKKLILNIIHWLLFKID